MKFTVPNPSLEITFDNEKTDSKPAILEIKQDGKMLVAVRADIEREKDTDGVWHNVVRFNRIK